MHKWLIIALLTMGLGWGQVNAQEAVLSPALVEQLEGIETYVSDTRGLELRGELIRVFPSREEVTAFLISSIEEQLPEDVVNEALAFYVAFEFMAADTDIVDVYLRLIEDQIGGYYDPQDKTMNTILISGGELGDALPMLEQVIYAHEFVHTLQDQHYDLETLGYDPENPDQFEIDQMLAIQALVEGDATVVMNLYTEAVVADNPLAALSMLSGSLGVSTLPPQDTPPILVRELFFPYNAGSLFVTRLINTGGWQMVDTAFTSRLPQSTEQIIHPERYLNNDEPITVTLNGAAPAADWTMVMEETLGEFYLRAYLDQHLETDEMRSAATGWGGDRYRIYQSSETGEYAMILRLAWDTAQDGDEFTRAYKLFLSERQTPITGDCAVGASDVICMVPLANGETLISRAPSEAVARALIEGEREF